jgi:hypothetical protein
MYWCSATSQWEIYCERYKCDITLFRPHAELKTDDAVTTYRAPVVEKTKPKTKKAKLTSNQMPPPPMTRHFFFYLIGQKVFPLIPVTNAEVKFICIILNRVSKYISYRRVTARGQCQEEHK